MNKLDGKVVIVTGATGGIGRALCHALADEGCRLGLLSRTAEKLDQLADELRQSGTEVCPQPVDLRDQTAVEGAVTAVRRELGAIDVLVHNAGVGFLTSAAEANLDELEEMIRVNYLGGVYLVAAVLPEMLRRGSGQVVAISSLAALRGMAHAAGYSASKAAFAVCLESLRPALRLRGIATSTCYLGFVRSPLSVDLPFRLPLWMISAEAAAGQIVRTISRRRREAYFPWYDALGARLLRRLPPWAFDAVMAHLGRFVLRGEY